MRIVFCLNQFFPDKVGGIEIYTLELAKSLKAKGHQVLIIIPHFGKKENSRYYFEGIEVEAYAEPQVVDRFFIQNRRPPEGLAAFLEILNRFSPDLVHFQELTASNGIGIFHVQESKVKGIKTLMTFHLGGHSCHTGNLMYLDKKLCNGVINVQKCAWCSYNQKDLSFGQKAFLYAGSGFFHWIGKDTRRWNSKTGTALSFHFIIENLKNSLLDLSIACDHMVSITSWYREMLIDNGIEPAKITTIKQGLRKQSANPQEGNFGGKIRLVFVGRITKIKGLHLLIEAIKTLPQDKISLEIFGPNSNDGYYDFCLRQAAGIKNIAWKGILQPGTVVQTLSAYDVLCLPSICSEMSPLVIQEAFAAGLPVLASNVYGNAEQVRHGETGWLFQFGDANALRHCLNELLLEPQKIQRARQSLPAVRSFDTVAGDYESLYKKILSLQ